MKEFKKLKNRGDIYGRLDADMTMFVKETARKVEASGEKQTPGGSMRSTGAPPSGRPNCDRTRTKASTSCECEKKIKNKEVCAKILTHRRMGFTNLYGWAHNLKSVKITFWPTSGWLVELRLNTNKCILYCKTMGPTSH